MYLTIDLPNNAFKTYEIDAGTFRLRVGDRVNPQTLIGRSFRTGEAVTADCWGYITGINRNQNNRLLLVGVTGANELRFVEIPSYEEAFNGF